MQEQDDGPSDPAKVAATITAALAGGMIELPGFASAERFYITKRPDVRQNALLAVEVIERWRNDPTSEFTHGDAGRAIVSIRALLAAYDDKKFERDALFESCERKDARIAQLQQATPAVTHSNRPEVEVLIAGRHDLMSDIDRLGTLLRDAADKGITSGILIGARLDYKDLADFLDRLGAYIVGQDERLIATGEALSQVMTELDEALAERKAAVEDRDKADAAHGCAVRDHRAALTLAMDAGAQLAAEVEGLKGDVRAAEKAWDDEQAKRIKAEDALKAERNRCAALEMRIEGAIFALCSGWSADAVIKHLDTIEYEDKPRCRVVTSPRFYSDEQFRNAVSAMTSALHDTAQGGSGLYYRRTMLEAALDSLGMRRAAQ